MTKSLLALILLGLTLPLGCTVEKETPPDPLAKKEGFCEAWAKNACQADVVKFCNASDQAHCVAKQTDFCLGILPEQYSSKHAKECLAAVKAAYKDATLESDEIAVVLKLAEPCDQLSAGTSDKGEKCEKSSDCNTADGLTCIIKSVETEGECAKPEEIGKGDDCSGADQVCEDGYFCNGENCVVKKKTGAECEGDYQCKVEDRCVKGTVDADKGYCTPRNDLNETCSSDAECQSGYCALAEDATEGECAATIRLSRNEPVCESLR